MSDPTPEGHAKFSLSVPENTDESDQIQIHVMYRQVVIRAVWSDAERQDLIDLLKQAHKLIDRGHLEYEIARESKGIDADLSALFPEEVEDGE